MTPEEQALRDYVISTGLAHRVTSGQRPPRWTGDTSRHIAGLATDLAGPSPSRISQQLLDIFEAFAPVEHMLYELIYSGAPYNIKNGQRVSRYAVNDHWNHVHVAVDQGVLLPRREPAVPDDPNTPNLTDLAFFVPIVDANGVCTGYYMVSSTGEVHTWGPGAKFYGRSEIVT